MNTTISKEQIPAEADALQMVLDLNDGLTFEQLQPAHTETDWSWVLIETDQSSDNGAGTDELNAKYPFGIKSIEKSDENTLQKATQLAMEHFGTFEANIKRVEEEEDEEYYVFTKVRG